MAYQALYRTYRPTRFQDVVGQKHIITVLKNAISLDRISHAYVFSGLRGIGKTTIARIFAKAVNCLNPVEGEPCDNCANCLSVMNNETTDVVELDAASNNGVEQIRDILEKVNFLPSFLKKKVYIIDEAHMLSTAAFNALLKTLEEPPEHVIFILATTDLHKIPVTILSRCQHLEFKKLSSKYIIEKLEYVIKQENINIDREALNEIATISDGGMRDALGILEEVISYSGNNIKLSDIHDINGTITEDQISIFIKNIIDRNTEEVFKYIDKLYYDGKDFYKISEEIINYLRNLLIEKSCNKKSKIEISINDIIYYIDNFNKSLYEMKINSNSKLLFELCIIKSLNLSSDKPNQAKTIENQIVQHKNIRKIRINNTLCNFNKKQFLEFKELIKTIEQYKNESQNSELIMLLLDGEIKAYSNNYYIIVYSKESYVDEFNNNYKKIDELLYEKLNEKYRGIAVNELEWNEIKTKFNNHETIYKYINEEEN